MKTTIKRILLAGLALLVVGALILTAAMFSMKFDFRRLSSTSYKDCYIVPIFSLLVSVVVISDSD